MAKCGGMGQAKPAISEVQDICDLVIEFTLIVTLPIGINTLCICPSLAGNAFPIRFNCIEKDMQ